MLVYLQGSWKEYRKHNMKKILFVASVNIHFTAFHLPYLKYFHDLGYEVHTAARGEEEIPYVDVQHKIDIERSPLAKANLKAYRELKQIISESEFDLIHCHTPVASILTRLAARNARKKGTKVMYTAHGFHFYKGAPLINWLLYYPAERFCAHFTDALITINHEDYERAKTFAAKEVYYIPGMGVDCKKVALEAAQPSRLREHYHIPENAFVVLSVGELNQNKNHRVILEAIHRLFDNDIYYVICGKGDQRETLTALAQEYGMDDRLKLVDFQKNITEWLSIADVFAFPSIREGLPMSLLEAMAAGLPCVVTNIRGTMDIFGQAQCTSLYKSDDVNRFAEAIKSLKEDSDLCEKVGAENKALVLKFDIKNVKGEMQEIYRRVLL